MGNSVTVLDTLILFFYFISVFDNSSKNKSGIILPYMLLFIYVFVHSLVFYVFSGDNGVFMRAMHLINYISFVGLYNKKFFDIELGETIIKKMAIIATLFLIIQHICQILLGYSIPGQLPWFALSEANMDNIINDTEIYRFASFFSEPAAYAIFIACAIAHELFYFHKTDFRVVSLLCLGTVLSTSNTAVACAALLIGIYILRNGVLNKRNILFIIAFFVVFLCAQPYIEAINSRIDEGRSFEGRFNGYVILANVTDYFMFGRGFISPRDLGPYMPGFVRLIVYLGYIGAFVYLIVFSWVYCITRKKILLILFLFLNIGCDTFFGVIFLYFSCFFFVSKSSNEKSIYCNNKFQ